MHARYIRPSLLVYRATAFSRMATALGTQGQQGITNSVIREINEKDYQVQLESKKARIDALFSEYSTPALEVFESKPKHYRMRYVCKCHCPVFSFKGTYI